MGLENYTIGINKIFDNLVEDIKNLSNEEDKFTLLQNKKVVIEEYLSQKLGIERSLITILLQTPSDDISIECKDKDISNKEPEDISSNDSKETSNNDSTDGLKKVRVSTPKEIFITTVPSDHTKT